MKLSLVALASVLSSGVHSKAVHKRAAGPVRDRAVSSKNGSSHTQIGDYGIILNEVFDECGIDTQKLGFDFQNVALTIKDDDDGKALAINGLVEAKTTVGGETAVPFGFFDLNVLIPGDFELTADNFISGESLENMVYIGDLTQVTKDGDAMKNPLVIEMQTKAAEEGEYSFKCRPEEGDYNCNGWLMHRVAKSGSLVPENCKSTEYENHKYSDFRFNAVADFCKLADVQINGQYDGSEFTIDDETGYVNLTFTSNLPVDILVEADNEWTYASECSITAGPPKDPAASGSFIPLIPDSEDHKTGPCRTASGSSGSNGKQYTLYSKKNIDECRQMCIEDDTCLAFEARVNVNHKRCEIWHELPAYAKTHAATWSCNVKQKVIEEEQDRSPIN
eukprot:Awhi_evm1s13835